MSSFNNVPPQLWMLLSRELRSFLAEKFNVVKTGPAEIRDQEVVSDGYTVQDLSVMSLEKLCNYIGKTETFPTAWELTVAKAKEEMNPPLKTESAVAEIINVEDDITLSSSLTEELVVPQQVAEIIKTQSNETKKNK